MKEIKEKTIYVPDEDSDSSSSTLTVLDTETHLSTCSVTKQQLITFTVEEYNEHLKEILNAVAEIASSRTERVRILETYLVFCLESKKTTIKEKESKID